LKNSRAKIYVKMFGTGLISWKKKGGVEFITKVKGYDGYP
jgi:hypothetical protein